MAGGTEGGKPFDEQDLIEPGRFAWLDGQALGPYALDDFLNHLHDEHKPTIREWLANLNSPTV